ncbi:MAG: 30S ribosomal protein S11 [Candidatus Kerfeldbacteria bacterium CG08_land_8_20_14_0_20_43_14]|uniref:Small ribosomal subunit protein uS11 n=1 Tax=Candidatus Kerfeldbacteria bacterium CG08_land_8_20_14_0_20_43_14 TaxID=2014246 RepID=A0A2H0YRQ7_9BACT|nr:MAG: 30S ribosomal protein S11 [Candidatus Kerfeldbacteria bacterium CG08_land_8_20_14_0_20_43_14]
MTEEPKKSEELETAKKPAEKTEANVVSPKRRRKKTKKFVQHGIAHIQASYNNTIISITDLNGDVLGWASAGQVGFKGPKKGTPYAAGVVVKNLLEKIKEVGLRQVDVKVKGIGSGREAAIRALAGAGLAIVGIKDLTPIPHNGVRPPKVRRV